jgi:hypothetical protein
MRTLIVPCAGRSSRFPDMKPKWLLTHPDGELMVEKAISGLNPELFGRIIITIVKEHSEKYDAKIIAGQVFQTAANRKVEILELDDFTGCQAETVYQTIIRKNVTGEFVVKDSDNYVKLTEIAYADFVVGLNINQFKKEIYRLNSKSFLVVNDQATIVDIIEKQIKSEHICLGVYGFADQRKFCDAYHFLTSHKQNAAEIYLSHIVSFLIGTGKSVFKYLETTDFEDWGTLTDWRDTQKRYTTYFIDIDGVIFKNRGRYGRENWDNPPIVLEKNVAAIKKLINKGGQIVLTTSRGAAYQKELERRLADLGIAYHALVTGCNHTTRVLINDFAPTNPYPSCKAISMPRDGDLGAYLED